MAEKNRRNKLTSRVYVRKGNREDPGGAVRVFSLEGGAFLGIPLVPDGKVSETLKLLADIK